jgi:hypothetical protein
MGPLNSRNWRAQAAPPGSPGGLWFLSLAGEVEMPDRPPAIALTLKGTEIGPRPVLALNLDEITFSGEPSPPSEIDSDWYRVGLLMEVPEPQIEQVAIFYADIGIAIVDVERLPG